MPIGPHDIEADLYFLTTDEGGRSGPVRGDRYRPNCNFGLRVGETETIRYNDVGMEFVGRERAEPGDSVPAKLWFLSPEYQFGRLYEGFTFDVCEGQKVTARGKITRVCNDAMVKLGKV